MKKTGNPKRRAKRGNRKNLSKQEAERLHAFKRGLERYGLDNGQVLKIRRRHLDGKSFFVASQSSRVKVYRSFWFDLEIYYCWDTSREEIVTFLKPDWVPAEKTVVLDLIS